MLNAFKDGQPQSLQPHPGRGFSGFKHFPQREIALFENNSKLDTALIIRISSHAIVIATSE